MHYKHTDERAHEFFRWQKDRDGFFMWDSLSEGAVPTKTLEIQHSWPVCAYCGNRALPLQKAIRFEFIPTEYVSRGHCCVCKDAMDEVDIKKEIDALKQKHRLELSELQGKLPPISKTVAMDLLDRRAEQGKKELQKESDYWLENTLKEFDISVNGEDE